MNHKYRLIVHEAAKSPAAEAFRTLRTNIQFSKGDNGLKAIMFNSAGPGAGKSVIAANTAVAFAQAGKKVILMDCDLRKPVQHKIFNKVNRGITNVMVDGGTALSLLQKTDIENLSILTSGPIPPMSAELLGSSGMQSIFKELREACDYLIVDTPPVIVVTDAAVLASKVDGIILVLNAGLVRPEMAQKAKELLVRAKGHLLGTVLNRVEYEKEYSYYYYYGEQGRKQSRGRR